jgi:hypothetical protein
MARPRQPETEALEAAIRLAIDAADNSHVAQHVIRDIYTGRYFVAPVDGLIGPLPGDQELKAIVDPDGELTYL